MSDLISRQAVLDYIDSMPSELTEDGRRMIRRIRLTEYIQDTLPSADVPERKVGKWIREVVGITSGYVTTVMYRCLDCEALSISKYKYCPYCGAFMRGEEDDGK